MALSNSMAVNALTSPLSKLGQFFNTKRLTWILAIVAIVSILGIVQQTKRMHEIHAFNQAVSIGKNPVTDIDSFEAKFSTAYWLAKSSKYKEASLLYVHLLDTATPKQRALIQHNIGNIFFLKGLAINGTNMTVRNETEYLLRQAKSAYIASLKLDPTNWGTKHNLDRILTMLPATPTPGVGESDRPGLLMGNIPVGLP